MRLSKKELFEALKKGSGNIDQMKQEVNLVVNLICGLVTAEQLRGAGFSSVNSGWLTIGTAWGDWSVRESRTGIVAVFYSAQANCRTAFGFASDAKVGDMPMHNVASVWQSVPTFVSEMLKTFPHLEERIQPLLEAAKLNV